MNDKKDLLSNPVRDLSLNPDMTVRDLIDQFYNAGGFSAKDLSIAARVTKKMLADDKCFVFLSTPAAPISTGFRGVVRDLVKDKKVNAIITTCGFMDHDLARLWKDYYAGSYQLDDSELHRAGVNRLANVLVPNESYGEILEENLQPIFKSLYDEGKKDISTRELIHEIGKRLEDHPKKEESITYWAYKNDIPIFVPGPTDGAWGFQLHMFMKKHSDFRVDVFKDERELSSLIITSEKAGALMIGGGISKHHTIWWSQFRDGLDYAVYVTTAYEFDGSLSGAPLREAISWGKIKEDARQVTVYGDATIIVPLILTYALSE